MRIVMRSLLIVLVCAAASWLLHVLPFSDNLLRVLNLRIFDTILTIDYTLKYKLSQPVYDNIVIIDVDDKSIDRLGQFSKWPNHYFADAVNMINLDSPKVIGLDIFFTDSDTFSDHSKERILRHTQDPALRAKADEYFATLSGEEEFAQSIYAAGNVFLGMFDNPNRKDSSPLPANLTTWKVSPKYYLELKNPHPPRSVYSSAAYGTGFTQVRSDESDTIHDFPLFLKYKDDFYVNFSTQICLDLLGVDSILVARDCVLFSGGNQVRRLPLDPRGKLFLKYYGAEPAFRYISFSDLILGRVEPGYFENRIVLIGSSATGLGDIKPTPFIANLPGVELHANLIRNILEEDFVHWVNPFLQYILLILLIAVLVMMIYYGKPVLASIYFLVVSVAALVLFAMIYMNSSFTMDYSHVLIPWFLSSFALMYDFFSRQLKEKKKVHDAFGHYVSADVIKEIMKDKKALRIGGEKKQIAALYIDIRKFSTYCEMCLPDDITSFLHKYFNRVTRIITDNRGLLDKYIGDAVLALYNVPYPYPDHVFLACKSALEIRDAALEIRQSYAAHPVLHDFKIGIGISSGEVIVGNIGSDSIFNYTGIGNTMNLSSRLEGLNKYYGTAVIIDESVHEIIKDRFFCRHLDFVNVKGKQISTNIYELLGYPGDESQIHLKDFVRHYENGLGHLLHRDFAAALDEYHQAIVLNPEDPATQLMIERLEIVNWETWDGVWRHEHK